MNISFIFLLISFLCFLLSAANFPPLTSRVNLIALGLAFWVLTLLIGAR